MQEDGTEEEKTEVGEFSTSAAVKEAEEYARRTTGRPAAVLVSDWTPAVLPTEESSVDTAVQGGNKRRVEEVGGVRANGPLMRAAKKR